MTEVLDKPEVKAEKPAKKALKMYWITFAGEGGDVEIGHNYKLNLYKRNVRCPIDENYLQVVKDAVITTHVQDENGKPKLVRLPQFQYEVEPQ